MVIVLTLLVLAGTVAPLAVLVRSDGLGWRPPPAVRPEQERLSTWPR